MKSAKDAKKSEKEGLLGLFERKIGGPKKKFGKQTSNKPKSRKELRKEMRKNKKCLKHNFILNRLGKLPNVDEDARKAKNRKRNQRRAKNRNNKGKGEGEDGDNTVKQQSLPSSAEKLSKKRDTYARNQKLEDDMLMEQFHKEANETRRKRYAEDNEKEEKEINRIAKNLRLNKKDKYPESFKDDGEDGLYLLLDICQSLDSKTNKEKKSDASSTSKQKKSRKNESDDEDMEESDEEEENFTGGSSEGSEDEKSVDSEEEDMDEDGNKSGHDDDDNEQDSIDMDEDVNSSEQGESENRFGDKGTDSNVDSDNDIGGKELKMKSKSSKMKKKIDDGLWEDIYGRMRRPDGSVVDDKSLMNDESITESAKLVTPAAPISTASSGKYVPPMRRGNQTQRDKITRNLKGLLNRLSEGNMHSISTQIEELYMANSRNEMNECVLELLYAMLLRKFTMPEKVILEHVMLIAILHANIGTEIGAFFLQNFVQDFRTKYDEVETLEDNKELENLVLLISAMYHFKVVDACLVYDILNFMAANFNAKDIELILTALRSVGFRLRKDDPMALKSLIMLIQQKAALIKSGVLSAKVKFMIDVVTAIRNNNVSKIPNYDPYIGDHLQKILKSHIHKGNYVSVMKIKMADLLNAETKGRWWIVGSAWSNTKADESPVDSTKVDVEAISSDKKRNAKLLAKARKLGMNTETRKNVFCILMTAEDYLDAFEKLDHLDLKNNQEREIIHVSTYCCLHEKKFNPYYALIVSKFCSCERKFMYPEIFKSEIAHYAKLLGQRSTSRLFSISQRRVFEWLKRLNVNSFPEPVSNNELSDADLDVMDNGQSRPNQMDKSANGLSSRCTKQIINMEAEKEIHDWIVKQLPCRVSSSEIRQKAVEIYRAKGHNSMKCSYGWYRRFLSRFQMTSNPHEETDPQTLAWLLQQYDQNHSVSYAELQAFAQRTFTKVLPNFKASVGWASRFFKRHHILVNWNGIYENLLPTELDQQVEKFRKRMKQSVVPKFSITQIGCMDEIPLNFSSGSCSLEESNETEFGHQKVSRLKKLSIKNCEATVLLTLMADGTLLPPFVIMKGNNDITNDQVYSKADTPVIVFYCVSTEPSLKCLQKWLELIWSKSVAPSTPSLLLFDAYNLHESLKDKCENSNIVFELFPLGCSSKLQPINSSARKLFVECMGKCWQDHVKKGSLEARIQLPSTDTIVQWVTCSYKKVRKEKELLGESFQNVSLM